MIDLSPSLFIPQSFVSEGARIAATVAIVSFATSNIGKVPLCLDAIDGAGEKMVERKIYNDVCDG